MFNKDDNIHYYYLIIFILLYFVIQRQLRYKLLNESKKVNLNDNNEIEKECENVVRRILEYDQPLMARFALELGQFRTFGIPTIGKLLASTGEYINRCPKRYDDTDLILREICENGINSERGNASIERLNFIHSHYKISNDDFLYTLCVFVIQPIRFLNQYGYRPLCQAESVCLHLFWTKIGIKMGIKNIPSSFDDMINWFDDYEIKHMKYHPGNQEVAKSTLKLFCSQVDTLFEPIQNILNILFIGFIGKKITTLLKLVLFKSSLVMFGNRLCIACGLEDEVPNSTFRFIIFSLLRIKSFIECYICLPRYYNARRTSTLLNNNSIMKLSNLDKDNNNNNNKDIFVSAPNWNPYLNLYSNGYFISKLGPKYD